jgi:hypothetical protein
MALYTSTYLKQLAATRASFIQERQRMFTESVKENKTFDIFLSHSFLDREEVLGVYVELSNLGFEVYVDWIVDPQLNRTNVTKESAELVRRRMRSSKSLLLAMSSNAELSKWIPWELGYMDGYKRKCALFPVSKSYTSERRFNRSEYLLLYPYIKKASIGHYENTFVTESSNRYATIDNWVKKDSAFEFNYKDIDIL